jgi:choline-glycine betaine transporter
VAEALTVYALVGAAAAWVVWRLVLPAKLKRSLSARLGRKSKGGCDNCGG